MNGGNTFEDCEQQVRTYFPDSHYIAHNGALQCWRYPAECPNGFQYGLGTAADSNGWTSCVLGGGLACGNDPDCCGGATGTGADSRYVCLKSVSICSMHPGCCANYTHNSPEHHECVVDFLERNSDPAICGTHSFYGGGFYESWNANYDWFQCHGFLDIMGNPGTLYAAGLTGGLNSSALYNGTAGRDLDARLQFLETEAPTSHNLDPLNMDTHAEEDGAGLTDLNGVEDGFGTKEM